MDVYEISQSVVLQCETFDLRLSWFNFALGLYNGKKRRFISFLLHFSCLYDWIFIRCLKVPYKREVSEISLPTPKSRLNFPTIGKFPYVWQHWSRPMWELIILYFCNHIPSSNQEAKFVAIASRCNWFCLRLKIFFCRQNALFYIFKNLVSKKLHSLLRICSKILKCFFHIFSGISMNFIVFIIFIRYTRCAVYLSNLLVESL